MSSSSRHSPSHSLHASKRSRSRPESSSSSHHEAKPRARRSSSSSSGKTAVYPKWHKFRIGSKFAFIACIAGVMGSFLFGFNLGLLNASINFVASELWPCDPNGEADAWDTLQISDECLTVMKDNPTLDIAVACSGDKADDEKEVCKVLDTYCTAPTHLSCDYVKWMNAILSCCVFLGAFMACMVAPKLMGMTLRTLNSITMLIFIVGDFCSVCAGSIASMCCARLIVGIGVGMTSIASPMYISQMSPMTKKGTYGTAHQLFITIGILVAVLIGLAFGAGPFLKSITYDAVTDKVTMDMEVESFDAIWWRVMMGLGFIPVIINLLVFAKVDMNTPREYIERGHYEDAKQGLMRIYKTENFSSIEQYYNDIFVSIEEGKKAVESGMTFGKAMKDSRYRKMILIGCVASAIQQLSGINVFVAASNQLFAQSGVEPAMITVLSVVMSALNVLMTFPTLILIEKMGRKSLMVMGIGGQCIGAILPTIGEWVHANDPSQEWTQYLSIVGIYLLVCSFAVAMGPVLWVWFTEIFPADVNNAASAALVASNWLTGIIMVFVGTTVTDNKILFTVFTVLNVLSLIFMIIFCKETKGLPAGQSPYLMD